jgi:hypothetical protein
MNHDAAWRTAAAMFAEHNAAVAAGDKSPWFKIAGEIVPPTRAYTENGQKITVADFRNHWVNVVLTAKSAKVQAKFAATLEAIKAETGKGKPEKPSSAVALGSISLDDDDDTAED